MKLIICFAALFFTTTSPAFAGEDAKMFLRGKLAAKAGNSDYAYMYYKAIVKDYPKSKYRRDSLFAKGEYHFLLGDYDDARKVLRQFTSEFPEAEAKPFALMYLYKIASDLADETLMENYEYELVSLKQVSFMFRKYEEFEYVSPLNVKHRVRHFIDKIEFYIDGDLLVEVSY